MDQIGKWCRENNIMLDGHMMEEPTLWSQTTALGEAMRCYRRSVLSASLHGSVSGLPRLLLFSPQPKSFRSFRSFRLLDDLKSFFPEISATCWQREINADSKLHNSMQMPGMDLLVDRVELNTAKQVSSVARQNGIRGGMSEIYGVTHWYFTFEGHKGCGDWQAALGITFRVHHLTWVSMAGEGKRDYPACIGYQSPWYKEYGFIEEHFARVGVAMTRGNAVTRIGVIHPIESYWLCFGPNGGDEASIRDRAFEELTSWLLHGLVDFDFVSESLLPGQYHKGPKGKLPVGHCEYDIIILPNLRTIRSSTLKILREFSKNGGTVIIAGSAPQLVDAEVPSSAPLIDGSKNVFWSRQTILHALEQYRELRISTNTGPNIDNLLYQMRQDDCERFVFICNTDRNSPIESAVQLKGIWAVRALDTFTGEERLIHSDVKEGWTTFPYRFEGCASLLLRLLPSSETAIQSLKVLKALDDINNSGMRTSSASELKLDSIELSEPNVLMLDYAEYKLDDENWNDVTEVLRIDNFIRERLDLPRKGSAWKQPWAVTPSERFAKAKVTLRFTFESAFSIKVPTQLALEPMEGMEIHLNDIKILREIDSACRTWWVDQAIETVPIPGRTIKAGKNSLIIEFPFGILTNIERVYLLGNFKVPLRGDSRALLQPFELQKLTWGDITSHGLPFYAGNVIYNCRFFIPSGSGRWMVTVSAPNFSSPVLTVTDLRTKKSLGRIAFQPHTLILGIFDEGEHKIAITAFGNRYNAFGHIHLRQDLGYCGPDVWRSKFLFPLGRLLGRY